MINCIIQHIAVLDKRIILTLVKNGYINPFFLKDSVFNQINIGFVIFEVWVVYVLIHDTAKPICISLEVWTEFSSTILTYRFWEQTILSLVIVVYQQMSAKLTQATFGLISGTWQSHSSNFGSKTFFSQKLFLLKGSNSKWLDWKKKWTRIKSCNYLCNTNLKRLIVNKFFIKRINNFEVT